MIELGDHRRRVGGARVSLLTAARHPESAAGLAIWWISGGVYGLLSLATHYCGGSIGAAWTTAWRRWPICPSGQRCRSRTHPPGRFLSQDTATFISTLENWMLAYCPRDGEHVPGLPTPTPALEIPAPVFRSGESDAHHTRATSEALAICCPRAGSSNRRGQPRADRAPGRTGEGLFARWPRLAPQLLEWQAEVLG